MNFTKKFLNFSFLDDGLKSLLSFFFNFSPSAFYLTHLVGFKLAFLFQKQKSWIYHQTRVFHAKQKNKWMK